MKFPEESLSGMSLVGIDWLVALSGETGKYCTRKRSKQLEYFAKVLARSTLAPSSYKTCPFVDEQLVLTCFMEGSGFNLPRPLLSSMFQRGEFERMSDKSLNCKNA